MEEDSHKERLEQELGFLKESFDAEVISKEEYAKGKERIEKKLKDIEGHTAKQDSKEEKEKSKKEQPAQDPSERIKLNVIQDEADDGHNSSANVEIRLPKDPAEPAVQTIPYKSEEKEEKNKGKFLRYAVIFTVLVIAAFFSYSFLKGYASSQQEKSNAMNNKIYEIKIPETNDDAPKIGVIVLNDRNNCFNCDTGRVLNILEGMFGEITLKEVDYNTNEGKALAEKLDLRLLPAYILNDSIEKNENYNNLRQIFIKKEGKYVLSEDASGSAFYFKRENIPNKLDFFAIPGDNTGIKAEANLKEFLNAFREVKLDKHSSGDNITKEIGIRNFPAFLVNNRIRFSGVYSSEFIKENFCMANKLEACKKSLTKSLI